MKDVSHAELAGRRVTVMGLGLFGGGAGVTRYLALRGARVTVTDLRSAADLAPALREIAGLDVGLALGGHRVEDFAGADLVVANPAVPPDNTFLAAARAAGVEVTSEIALFLELCPSRIAAVTGTQGKSSTCFTLAQLLESCGQTVHLGGNIGGSLLESAAAMQPDDVVVLEISSYQLEALPEGIANRSQRPRVEVVAVTNVLADHLERHGSADAYAAAKRRILELADARTGTAVLPGEDPRMAAWNRDGLKRVDVFPTRRSDVGLNFDAGRFRLDREGLGRVADLRLPGAFQRENTLVSLGMARILGVEARQLADAVAKLRALPHRLEDLGVRRGHRVWDNGVSTTPDSTISALASIEPGCTLLVGGKAKNLPLDELVDSVRRHVRRVIAFGAAAQAFGDAFRRAGVETWTADALERAVAIAFERMEPGAELLFSPACASFDAYLNFRERALAFRRALPELDAQSATGAAR
jgi:UDP-N-acetylmuramoylalanine--D-glutamate ligase